MASVMWGEEKAPELYGKYFKLSVLPKKSVYSPCSFPLYTASSVCQQMQFSGQLDQGINTE